MAVKILMPALSPTMTEGKLANWLKKEGDTIESGDVIAEIETDKATMEVEAVEEGTLGKIVVAAGTEGVAVNSPIAVLLEEGDDESAIEEVLAGGGAAPQAEAPKEEPKEEAKAEPAPAAESKPAPQPSAPSGDRIFASPLAKRMAEQAGLDLSKVTGSGPHGRIVKADIEAAVQKGGAQAAPAAEAAPQAAPAPAAAPMPEITAPYTEVPNSSMRKVIAKRLTESKQTVPHFYLTVDCELDALLDMRKQLNAKSPEGEGAYKISVNDFIIRAVALALRKVPAANATWTDEAILQYDDVDVSVAVATPKGLLTPVVRKADTKGLVGISQEMKDLSARARDGKLMPEDYQGGGFTISNMGMMGVKEFSAIINPPQSCILAIGAGEQRPVVKDGALSIATVMTITLSVDHRSVDGAVGAEFLAALKPLIEDPLSMLL